MLYCFPISSTGGAGEGKQHLGPNLIPNKPRIVPEITPPVYDNPPNPCSSKDMENCKSLLQVTNYTTYLKDSFLFEEFMFSTW